MRDSEADIRSTLQYVVASDIPAQHKAVLIAALTQTMRHREAAYARRQVLDQAGPQWQPHEEVQLQAFLQGKVARGWQHGDEMVMHLASQLHRSPGEIRAKATELGFGAGVNYGLARAHARLPKE